MVRAKFRCTAITHRAGYNSTAVETDHVVLNAAMGEENKEWSKYTPSGQLEMQITNPEALSQFKVGQCYFIDFSPAPDAS